MTVITFELYTTELTRKYIPHLKWVCEELEPRLGRHLGTTNAEMRAKMEKETGLKIGGPKMRKIIQTIRNNHILFPKVVIARGSYGYFIATNDKEMAEFGLSLRQRSNACLEDDACTSGDWERAKMNVLHDSPDQLDMFNQN